MGIYQKLYQYLKENKPVVLVSKGNNQTLEHQLFFPEDSDLPEIALSALKKKRLLWKHSPSGEWEKAESFYPPVRLYLVGGGHISKALAALASLISLPFIVIDDRPDFANEHRFPLAEEIICDDFIKGLSSMDLNPSSFVVVATRGHRHDQDCLQLLMKKSLAYIGMVSSRRRARTMKEILQSQGLPEERVASLHAPIGIDIKAKTPAEIAVSIIAEIIKHKKSLFPTEEADKVVLEQAQLLEAAGQKAVMATIVETKGSSPRKAGARMLIFPEGRIIGTIGGGCGEAEVKREALNIFDTGRPAVYHLDLTADMAAEEGMACGGTMQVLLEPLGV